MNNEYNISIKAIIDLDGKTSTSSNKTNLPFKTQMNVGSTSEKNSPINSMAAMAGISYGRQQANKLLNTFGSEQVKNISSQISKASMYTIKGVRAIMTQNPLEIADVTLDIVCDIAQQMRQLQQAQATISNEEDQARIKAGLLNIDNTIITPNWWSGRYQYKRRG